MIINRKWLGICIIFCAWQQPALAGEVVDLNADFPGGNVQVIENLGETVRVQPDLRGGRPWFYWYFEAEAIRPGRVAFVFPDAPKIGVRGPAISRDAGRTWQWMGTGQVTHASPPNGSASAAERDSFHYEFTSAGETVRFAVGIPYVPRDLHAFLARHESNPHLHQSVLTESGEGRPVPLLRIGEPGPGVQPMLLTGRHHACEAMASYTLEGFVEEAMSDSPAGVAFRERYVLYVVPFVDLDGVIAGDQGKNRRPHDHNRDYGRTNRYPEIAAIQALHDEHDFRFALDMHCPFLRGDIHEVFYFDGLRLPHIEANTDELIRWLGEESPPAISRTHNFLKTPTADPPTDGMPNSHYFGYGDHTIMAVTLEVPYTQRNTPLDADMARQYGVGLARAWMRTPFVADASASRGPGAHASLVEFRSRFRPKMGQPDVAKAIAEEYLNNPSAPAAHRVEANLLMAKMRLRHGRYEDALRLSDAVLDAPGATTTQRAESSVLRVEIVAHRPASTAAEVERALEASLSFPNLAPAQSADIYQTVSQFHERAQDYKAAMRYARKQVAFDSRYDRGRTLNRIAALHDRLDQPEQAIAARKQAVKVLRAELDPVPVGIFGLQMARDLFEALDGIPTATLEEKIEAANIAFDHPVGIERIKQPIRERLDALTREQTP